MTEEGKPTGISREDVEHLGVVDFEGRRAQLYRAVSDSRVGMGQGVLLELDLGGERLALFGYFSGDDFLEVDREPIV